MTDNKFELDFSYFRIVGNSERGDCGLQLTTEDTKSENEWLAYWNADNFAECSEIEFEHEVLNIIKDIIFIAKEKAKTLGQGDVSWKRKCDCNGEKFLTTKSPLGRIMIRYLGITDNQDPYMVTNNLENKECGILELKQILANAKIPYPSDEDFKWIRR